jgi:subtilisin family serine protease
VSLLAATALVTALVGLPAGSTAPPPGTLVPGAKVQVLDRQLGIVAVDLPRLGSRRALVRLRMAPGVRYATVPTAAGGLAAGCGPKNPVGAGTNPTSWRSTIHLTSHSAAGFTVGIADSGADVSRLGGARDRLQLKNFTQGSSVADDMDHGTEVASLIAGSRSDIKVSGVAPDAGLAIARIVKNHACDPATLARNLIPAFAWFRSIGDVQIVNVSANIAPNPALIEELRALQQAGTLVVAATGDAANPGKATFPASQPHVIGVGALGSSTKSVWSDSSRGPQVDLVAPGIGSGVILSSLVSPGAQFGVTPDGTSFASPLVAGAAALVWAKHPAWDASRVAAALTTSAKHLSGPLPNTTSGYGLLDVKAALAATPPADLDEPNDWASAAQGLAPLAHKVQLSARVGGNDDPLDAYPVVTKGASAVSIAGAAALSAYLLPEGSLSTLDNATASTLRAAASVTKAGTSMRLKVPRKGKWYVVVTAPDALTPVGYTVRVG